MSRPLSDRIEVPEEVYATLAQALGSDTSPVGIDAKKTHVIILHILLDLQERLSRLETRLDGLDSGGDPGPGSPA